MELLDSRRLTGPNLQHQRPGAVAEVGFDSNSLVELELEAWNHALDRILSEFNLEHMPRYIRRYEGGASIGFVAPIDKLYGATEMNEWAIAVANAVVNESAPPSLERGVSNVQEVLDQESNERMCALQREATARGVPFIWDDDFVSIGMGKFSTVWETTDLPLVEDVSWENKRAVPVVLVTGTNGKTTSSRLISRILCRAGMAVGSTSTDGVCVNETVVEGGDWTGPGAARMVLRRDDVDAAVLESARGGLLRRGIGVDSADVALVTNVGDDHLGSYGVIDIPQMASVKNLICSVVTPSGVRVLNADDPELSKLGDAYSTQLVWFSLDPSNSLVEAHCAAGGQAWVYENGILVHRDGDTRHPVLSASEIPLTIDGAALHNVSNALGAMAVASSLGVSYQVMAEALREFGSEWEDNPGRCQRAEIGGVNLIFDFGHNPHGIQAILGMARRLLERKPGARLGVSIGQAGDRSDRDIFNLAKSIWSADPSLVLARDIPGYERGREPGEVARLLQHHLVGLGMSKGCVQICDSELAALEAGFSWAEPGDILVTLVHLQREQVQDWLEERGATRR